MVEFERGQFFLDHQATNYQGQKGKYFIALTDAECDDDLIVCFVLNTERRMELHTLDCNKEVQKYILAPNSFSFVRDHSAIMLSLPCCYKLIEMYKDNIQILNDKADEVLCRRIKNCIDLNQIIIKFAKIIKECYKSR